MNAGVRVIADNDCYRNESGVVTRVGQNLFGRVLIYVKMDKHGSETCFYRSELRLA